MLSVHIRYSENMTNQKHINHEQYGLFAISDTKTRVFSCMLGNKKKMAITLMRSLTFFLRASVCIKSERSSAFVCLLGNKQLTLSYCTGTQMHENDIRHLSVDKNLFMGMNYVALNCYISALLPYATAVTSGGKKKNPTKTTWKDFNKTVKFWWEWATLLLWQEVSREVFSSTVKLQEVFHLNSGT